MKKIKSDVAVILNKSIVWRASRILDNSDRKKAFFICLAYITMGLLDVAAIFIVGIIGSLAVSGISTNQPGTRVGQILSWLHLEGTTLQKQITILGLGAASILTLKSLVSLYLSSRILRFLSRRAAVISQRLIDQLFNQDIINIREKTIQEIIYAVTSGVNSIVVGVFGSTLLLCSDVILLMLFGATLFVVDVGVAISSLIFFAGFGYFLYRLMHLKAIKLGEIATTLNIKSSDRIGEVVNCYRELLVKDRRNYYALKIGEMRFDIADASAKLSVMNLLSKYIMEISMVLGVLLVGTFQFLSQPATRAVAVISIFLASSARIVPGVLRLQTGIIGIKTAIASAKPTLDLLENHFDASLKSEQNAASPYLDTFLHSGFVPEIHVEMASFAYPSRSTKAIDEVSLSVKPGEFIGIVGPSGSGKSTLVDLILGVITQHPSPVRISGLEPRQAVKLWPGAIAYVPQDANFVNGSIKENISLGYSPEEVPDSKIESLLKSVHLEELLALPMGINSDIGEKGGRLSGGQRQRLGIARALLTNPRLLILDEATSALDSSTEQIITEYLETLKGNLTLVVIAHRLSTVKSADRIFYLKKGKILGVGKFDALRKKVPDFDAQARRMGIR